MTVLGSGMSADHIQGKAIPRHSFDNAELGGLILACISQRVKL